MEGAWAEALPAKPGTLLDLNGAPQCLKDLRRPFQPTMMSPDVPRSWYRSSVRREFGGQRLRLAASVIVLCVAGAACSSGDADPETPPTSTRPKPAEGAPAVCTTLSESDALVDLPLTIRAVAVEGTKADVEKAAALLREVTAELPSAANAADALIAWASAPSEPTSVDALATRFTALEGEVQSLCDFPLS